MKSIKRTKIQKIKRKKSIYGGGGDMVGEAWGGFSSKRLRTSGLDNLEVASGLVEIYSRVSSA